MARDVFVASKVKRKKTLSQTNKGLRSFTMTMSIYKPPSLPKRIDTIQQKTWRHKITPNLSLTLWRKHFLIKTFWKPSLNKKMNSVVKILFNKYYDILWKMKKDWAFIAKKRKRIKKKNTRRDNLCNEMSRRKSNKLPIHSGITSRDLQMSKLLNRRFHCCALIAINIMRILRNICCSLLVA